MQQLFEDVFLLEGVINGRPLQLIYLQGESASLLLDTGCSGDPEGFISAQIREAGGNPAALRWIVNSHTDLDHTGGNYAMKQIAPQAILACGDADRAACSDPAVLYDVRYDAYRKNHGIFYDAAGRDWIMQQCGQHMPVDVTFTHGEHIRLADDWEIEIVALPGHAKGHIGLLDSKNSALYGGDAIHGAVYLGLDGTPKLPPTYLHVDDYLHTIDFIDHLPIETYVGCHWPVKRGIEIAAFCAESRDFVHYTDALVREALTREWLTLRELCLQLAPQLGGWEHVPALDLELAFALNGHLESLIKAGRLDVRQDETAQAFTLVMA